MFVRISPSFADTVETLCSLIFVSYVRGVDHGPAHKQADTQEFFLYKQMVRFATREQLCRSLQEKTRDLESQLAEERKARLQHENRVATASAKTSSSFTCSYKSPVK
ncbi:hypothetical protein IFM89_030243 [Coptis chinensis]|uniref:Uncharacterized protein n=1 Tax=Coptis chinensis TaxID=261450 RepID=A0A835HVP1_9MAGN|nr:hypothetical protein IFM89_030243 [Coptis chinensis]